MVDLTDQQERLDRLEGIERNAEWLKENWESEDSMTISKRLGLIKGDVERLIVMAADNDEQPEVSSDE